MDYKTPITNVASLGTAIPAGKRSIFFDFTDHLILVKDNSFCSNLWKTLEKRCGYTSEEAACGSGSSAAYGVNRGMEPAPPMDREVN